MLAYSSTGDKVLSAMRHLPCFTPVTSEIVVTGSTIDGMEPCNILLISYTYSMNERFTPGITCAVQRYWIYGLHRPGSLSRALAGKTAERIR